MHMNTNIFKEAASLKEEGKAFAIAVITGAEGSTPRSEARMLVRDDGTTLGTVGGGKGEQYVIARALEAIAEGKSRACRFPEIDDDSHIMLCGGWMSFFIDVETPGYQLLLLGAGHVNQAVARLGAVTGFSIIVPDDRKSLLKAESFPPSTRLVYGETIEEAAGKVKITGETYIVVATGSEDKDALRAVLAKGNPYLAMLGSRGKAALVKRELLEEGISQSDLDRVLCPAGLDLGAETPDEIAVSLISQMMMVRSGADGRELFASKNAKNLIVVRGAGDIASGTIARLHRSGYKVLALETAFPTVIRRTVSFADAARNGEMEVEGIMAKRAEKPEEIFSIHKKGQIAVAVDPEGKLITLLKPAVVIDAILAKKNLGTRREMAPVTVGFGPGFTAGEDVHYVVETMRGHSLAKIITEGPAMADTRIPGAIDGYTEERLLRAPADGRVEVLKDIGELVTGGETLAMVGGVPAIAPLTGKIRGMILHGTVVHKGMKMGDVDPRGEKADHLTISEKAYAIGGSVLEILLREGICP